MSNYQQNTVTYIVYYFTMRKYLLNHIAIYLRTMFVIERQQYKELEPNIFRMHVILGLY